MEKQIYFNAPIELYRRFIDDTRQCLDNVLDYCIAEYDTAKDAEERYQIEIGDWGRSKMNGTKLRKGTYNGTQFSIPRHIFFDYYENYKTKTQRQIEMLLGYLALKSISGRWPMIHTCNDFMFARMAGYPSTKALPDRAKLGLIAQCNTPDKLRRVRNDIMDHFLTVHIYSKKHGRGFCVMFTHESEHLTRRECMERMAGYMELTTQKYRDKLRDEQMKEARERAKLESMTKQEKKKAYFRTLNLNL